MGYRRSAWIVAGVLLMATPWANAAAATSQQALRWDADTLGNHRYLVQVDAPAAAVRVVIPWRRRDAHPEQVHQRVERSDGARDERPRKERAQG